MLALRMRLLALALAAAWVVGALPLAAKFQAVVPGTPQIEIGTVDAAILASYRSAEIRVPFRSPSDGPFPPADGAIPATPAQAPQRTGLTVASTAAFEQPPLKSERWHRPAPLGPPRPL